MQNNKNLNNRKIPFFFYFAPFGKKIFLIFLPNILRGDLEFQCKTYLCKEVVINLHPAISKQLSELCRWADEKVVANDVTDRFFIHVAILGTFPVGVLKWKN